MVGRVAAVAGVICAVLLAPSPAFASNGWSAPTGIDGNENLLSVSCGSATFCVATDIGGNALTFNGSAWSGPKLIDSSNGTGNGLDSVSCPSSSFCVAVDDEGGALTFNGSSWSAPREIDDSGYGLSSVSCPSSSFCVAVDGGGNALTFNGSSWSAPKLIDSSNGTGNGLGNGLDSVSCPSSSFCVAVDDEGGALTFNGSSWSAPADIDGVLNLDSVSCPSSSSFCVAVDDEGGALTFNGSSWSAPTEIDDNPSGPLSSVSCPSSSSFCVAVDEAGNALTFNGSSWSAPKLIDSRNGTGNGLDSVSCPSSSFCVAVDHDGDALTYSGGTGGGSTGGACSDSGWSAGAAVVPLPATAIAAKTLDQPLAYFALARSSNAPTAADFKASISWGKHGPVSTGTVSERAAGGSVLQFTVSGSHRFGGVGKQNVAVSIACPGGASVRKSVTVDVIPADPGASFYSDPATPSLGHIALLVPEGTAPGQRKIVREIWAFADGSPRVVDSPSTERTYMSVVKALIRDPASKRLQARARRLDIIPVQNGFLGMGNLSSGKIRGIAQVWKHYFPLHIIPHIYPNRGTVQVAHEVLDTARVKREAARKISISPHCYVWGGGWIPVLNQYTTCDTQLGFELAFSPNRRPDYLAYDVSGSSPNPLVPVGMGATLTVTNDGSVFVGLHAGLSAGASVFGVASVAVSSGYIGSPHEHAPADWRVDDFVGGWTIPVQAYAVGYGYSLIYSPKGAKGYRLGEEFAYSSTIAGVGLQPGCSVDLGKRSSLARLSPDRVGHLSASKLQATFASVAAPELPDLLHEAASLLPQLKTCALGVVDPVTILFGG
jgi:hypothetical protein